MDPIKAPIAGFVGRNFKDIDWELLLEAAYHISETKIVIAAEGVLDQSIKNDMRDNIFVIENVDPSEFGAYLSSFSLCLVPFLTGLHHADLSIIHQFIATKKPVVCTEIENLEEDLANQISMVKNAGELALAVRSQLENPHIQTRQRQKAIDGMSWKLRGMFLADNIRKSLSLSNS